MRLSDLKKGEKAIIVRIKGYGAFKKRVMEMGFIKGREIEAILTAPLKDPVEYSIMGYKVSLRRSEARMIKVIPLESKEEVARDLTEKTEPALIKEVNKASQSKAFHDSTHTINVVLIGNPNCGKTSMFNIASGATEHVGNYSGVTVDSREGYFNFKGYRINIVDLPGTYSLTAYSPEELYVRKYIQEHTPDVIINVVEALNLERNLFLTTQLIDMDRSMVIALNMYDELRRNGDTLDFDLLGKMIGVPIVPTVARTGEGVDILFDTVIRVFEQKEPSVRHIHVSLGSDIEEAIRDIREVLKKSNSLDHNFSPRYIAIKYLEEDKEIENILNSLEIAKELEETRQRHKVLIQHNDEADDLATQIANEKYGFISGALAEVLKKGSESRIDTTRLIDSVVTSRLFGFPLFIAIMFLIFWATFYIGAFPQEWIEDLVEWIAGITSEYFPDGPLKDLISDGVIGGVGGVIVFLPNIMILYFFISFMEDSGYMARAAFIMDKLMHKIGLHGKSFIPLMMGFGCNVPAIMSARTIESRSSRIITILIVPFMSCAARLPVYVLLVGTFFSSHAAFVLLSIYILGVLVAIGSARLFRKMDFLKDETPFVMELPPYRIPTLKATMRHMWWKGKQYLQKMGGIILLASIIVWALDYFPLHNEDSQVETTELASTEAPVSQNEEKEGDSYLEMIGKAINPVMEPLGFTWRGTVAALAAMPAKEIIVSTLGVLYTGDEDTPDVRIGERLTMVNPETGHPDFNTANALSFLVFVLLYCPCVAALVAIVREIGSIKYGLFSIFYNTAVAWIIAFIIYRIALFF